MVIEALKYEEKIWKKVSEYARECSWVVGKYLAEQMDDDVFTDWEKVVVATIGEEIAGYCTIVKTDCIPNVEYTPYIGYIFVGEEYRGQRLSEEMINFSMKYAKKQGFQKIYIVSGEVGLYEKYGFVKIDEKKDMWGNDEQIFSCDL